MSEEWDDEGHHCPGVLKHDKVPGPQPSSSSSGSIYLLERRNPAMSSGNFAYKFSSRFFYRALRFTRLHHLYYMMADDADLDATNGHGREGNDGNANTGRIDGSTGKKIRVFFSRVRKVESANEISPHTHSTREWALIYVRPRVLQMICHTIVVRRSDDVPELARANTTPRQLLPGPSQVRLDGSQQVGNEQLAHRSTHLIGKYTDGDCVMRERIAG